LHPAPVEQNGFYVRDDNGLRFLDLIVGVLEHGNRVRRNATIEIQAIGFPLMVEAGEIDVVLHIPTDFHDVEHYFLDGGNDSRSAGGARSKERLAVFHGRWEEPWMKPGHLPGAMAWASPCANPNRSGGPGFAAKSSHSSFNKYPGPGTVTLLPYPGLRAASQNYLVYAEPITALAKFSKAH
jgi:hypothetical protein